MPSPTREAIERYEARILAYERGRESGADPGRRPSPPRSAAPGATRRKGTSRPRVRAHPRPAAIRLRGRRIVVLTALILLIDLVVSFLSAMTGPSNVPIGVRAVEWLRDNGAAGAVSDIESIYYSLNAPATGGPPLKRLPQIGGGARVQVASDAPAPIAPVITPALPGEGQWRGTGPLIGCATPVLVATFRPDPNYPQMVAGVAWIDHTRTRLALYPGRYEPPNDGNQQAEVPPQLRPSLLATFNSGFKLEDSDGGFYSQGHLYAPLRDGQATLIGYNDGAVDVRTLDRRLPGMSRPATRYLSPDDRDFFAVYTR